MSTSTPIPQRFGLFFSQSAWNIPLPVAPAAWKRTSAPCAIIDSADALPFAGSVKLPAY